MDKKEYKPCQYCQKLIYKRPSEIKLRPNIVCKKCVPILLKDLASKHQRIKFVNYINRWKEGKENGMKGTTSISNHIRRYLFEKYNNKCCKCGWSEVNKFTGKIPLEVEHKDGDHTNNKEENLELICPNCHSLTSTYRALNMGKGRPRK